MADGREMVPTTVMDSPRITKTTSRQPIQWDCQARCAAGRAATDVPWMSGEGAND